MKGLRTEAAGRNEASVDTSMHLSDMGSNAGLDFMGRSLEEIAVERRRPFPDGPEP
jgi:hypothetical protein